MEGAFSILIFQRIHAKLLEVPPLEYHACFHSIMKALLIGRVRTIMVNLFVQQNLTIMAILLIMVSVVPIVPWQVTINGIYYSKLVSEIL